MKPANKVLIAFILLFFALLLAVTAPAQTLKPTCFKYGSSAITRFARSWNELGSLFEDQAPLMNAINEDYRRNNPFKVVLPDDVRAAQRTRRLVAWDQVIKNEEAILKNMRDARKAESEY